LQSLALVHAAIAGFHLFLSGLITGYFDNRAAYMHIGERIAALRRLRSLTGPAREDRIGVYIRDHLGGLMSNTLFGLMRGSTGVLGQIIGLPVDIRHIAFSAANLAYVLVTINFQLPLRVVVWSVLGVGLIGLVNLIVSFTLALWTALKSRGIRDVPFLEIFRVLWQKFLTEPRTFLRVPEEQP
jgi:site-specific recombinase